MPEEPPPESKFHPSIGGEFVVRNCHRCANDQMMVVQLLLPLSVSDEELRERYQRAAAECQACEERRRLDNEAREEQRLKEEQLAREANDAAGWKNPKSSQHLNRFTTKLRTGLANDPDSATTTFCI